MEKEKVMKRRKGEKEKKSNKKEREIGEKRSNTEGDTK